MTKIRTTSPKYIKSWKPGDDAATVRTTLSRSYWVGPQDYSSCRDYRFRQLLGFGLVDEPALDEAIATLEARHSLVSAEEAAAEIEPARVAERTQVIEAQARLAAIARLAETIDGDVSGLGSHAVAVTNGALASRLATVQGELAALADELIAARGPFVSEQVERLGLASQRDLKVHLGAGPTVLDGWVNCDLSPSQLSFNMSWGLPFSDGSVAFAYAGHAFEHLYYAAEAAALLHEIKRVLKPGGVFRFIVPNVGLFLRKYAENDRAFFDHWRKNIVKYFGLFDTPMELIMMYCFVGRDPSEFFGHKMGYDFETIEKIARSVGFSKIAESAYMASAYTELRVDEISPAANLTYNGERYSLFVELEL